MQIIQNGWLNFFQNFYKYVFESIEFIPESEMQNISKFLASAVPKLLNSSNQRANDKKKRKLKNNNT